MAKKQSGGNDNTCHLFAELDPGQPASAIVNFVTKVMIGQGKKDWKKDFSLVYDFLTITYIGLDTSDM